MRQLAAAAAGFEESHGTLPPGQGSANQSCLVALLAGIERVSLYSSFNFGIDLYDRANQTAIMTSVSGFLCPSDFNAMPALLPATNYAGNFGGTYFYDDRNQGTFIEYVNEKTRNTVSLNEIRDGASTTSLFAEWLTGIEDKAGDPRRLFYQQAVVKPGMTPDGFCADCIAKTDMAPAELVYRGRNWFVGRWPITLYDHGVTPNQPACLRKMVSGMNASLLGACSAGSKHPDGSNVAFVDGHVQFVRNTIHPAAWRAMGTINGGDLVPEPTR